MRVRKSAFVTIALAAVLATGVGCASLPETSRTGAIHSIRVAERPDPDQLSVNAGDEVRWVNARTLAIQIDLVGVDPKTLVCDRGFSKRFGGMRESVVLEPNASVSVCFSAPAEVKYNVRMTSALPGGKNIVSGFIAVAQPR